MKTSAAAHLRYCRFFLLVSALTFGIAGPGNRAAHAAETEPIPVILDTDIGDDIDDTWALGMLLKSPEISLKLVVGDQGKNLYRAKLIAKFLERAGRTDIPVGIGLDVNATGDGRQGGWVEDYNLNDYPGRVYPDGVQAMIDLILESPRPITLIAIGPLPNVAEALRREPRIAAKVRFVGMHGSVRKGYNNSNELSPEYNVRADVKACQQALSAPWEATITPLDTCGIIHLKGAEYALVRDSQAPIPVAIMENYRIWLEANRKAQAETQSSTLFDTVAVYLGYSEAWLEMETLSIKVTDDGFTRIDPAGKALRVATAWRDLDAYHRHLAERLVR